MTPYLTVVDGALADPWARRDEALAASYDDVPGPRGVVYPTIARDVPSAHRSEVARALAAAVGSPVTVQLSILRLTTADARPPYWAHTDAWYGSEFTSVLSLTPLPHSPPVATLLLQHETGLRSRPAAAATSELLTRDANDRRRWRVELEVPVPFNRLIVFPSNLYHAASPGFGSSPRNGRLVLVTFFSRG